MHLVLGLLAGSLNSLAGVSTGALAAAVLLHLGKIAAEARSWHWIVSHAHDHRVRFRTTLAAFVGSIGANVALPGRVGDAYRVGVVRRRVPDSSVVTITSTIGLETALEIGFGLVVVAVVLLGGGTPVPTLPADSIALAVVAVAALVAVTLGLRYREQARRLAARALRGFAVVRSPRAFVARVLSWKLLAWGFRLGSVYAFLVAFHLPASGQMVLGVVAAQSVAAILPLLPGNAGTQQAALLVALAGSASAASVLGFGVGMQAATAVADVVIGLAAIAIVAGPVGRRRRANRPHGGGMAAGMLLEKQ